MNIFLRTTIEVVLVLTSLALTLSEIVCTLMSLGISLKQAISFLTSNAFRTNLILLSCFISLFITSLFILTSYILNWINPFSRAFQIIRLISTILFLFSGIYFFVVIRSENRIANDIVRQWNNSDVFEIFQDENNCFNETSCEVILRDKINRTLKFSKKLVPSLSLFWVSTAFYLIIFFILLRVKKIYGV